MPAKIIIGADLVPTESNYNYFKGCETEYLIGKKITEKLNNADFTIFNLEVPLTDKKNPINKCGPNLSAPTDTIAGIKAINSHFFTLANNHILDQGEDGLYSTLNLLNQEGIAYAGAGKNLEEATKPYIVKINGITVGIYCCAEHEFTIATAQKAGANPFDALESLDQVYRLKSICDYVIVLYHGGKEHYRYPSPYLQKVCRKLVEKGADLVVCQHSHCIGAQEEWIDEIEEKYLGTIVYGQGNFLFDDCENEYWQTSLLIEVDIEKTEKIVTKINYIPLGKMSETVRIAQESVKQQILSEFQHRSQEILNSEKVEERYQKFADSMIMSYLSTFSGSITKKFFYRVMNKISGYRLNRWIVKRRYGKKERLSIQNFIECEAHRELILKGLTGEK